MKIGEEFQLNESGLNEIFQKLKELGFNLIGPVAEDGTIIYDEIDGLNELPIGLQDLQSPGKYQLTKRDDKALFGYNVGPYSFKKFLFPPKRRLFSSSKVNGSLKIIPEETSGPSYAFIGIRGCEIEALKIQDKVFMGGEYKNSDYQNRRSNNFIFAVNCSQAGNTCFCTSMDTGPKAEEGFDLSLTEVLNEEHLFVLRVGSEKGLSALEGLSLNQVTEKILKDEEKILNATKEAMTLKLETNGVSDLLKNNQNHPAWDTVAERCLSCANCTMVCPTCFCSTVEDTVDLTGDHSERWLNWDSCFTQDFSYIHGGSVRSSTKSKYRQWLTHKLSSWHDQFDSSGCVGCGRCITWCPPGINLIEEVDAIRE